MDAFDQAVMTRKLRKLEADLEAKQKLLKKNVVVYKEKSNDDTIEQIATHLEDVSNNVAKITKQLETFVSELADKLQFMNNTYPSDVSVAQIKSNRTRKDKEYIPEINTNVEMKSKTRKQRGSKKGISDALDALNNLGSDE